MPEHDLKTIRPEPEPDRNFENDPAGIVRNGSGRNFAHSIRN